MSITFNLDYTLPNAQSIAHDGAPNYCRVVLHATASTTAQSALRWWASNAERVGTPYVIDRDGTIYRAFDPAQRWAYHLGVGQHRVWWERTSIGIELVNVGPLRKRHNKLFWWPEDFTAPYIDGAAVETNPWNGFDLWQPYTNAQYEALSALLAYIKTTFNINALKRPTNTHFGLATSDFENPTPAPFTLLSHSNFNTVSSAHTGLAGSRPLCKNDVGPTFNWLRLE